MEIRVATQPSTAHSLSQRTEKPCSSFTAFPSRDQQMEAFSLVIPQPQRASNPLQPRPARPWRHRRLRFCRDEACHPAKTTSVWSDQRQFYGLEHNQRLNKSSQIQKNHTTSNKLLLKYTRISLVLTGILNLSVSPSYGLETLLLPP